MNIKLLIPFVLQKVTLYFQKDNVEEVVEETTKRFRHYSEPSAARSGSRNSR